MYSLRPFVRRHRFPTSVALAFVLTGLPWLTVAWMLRTGRPGQSPTSIDSGHSPAADSCSRRSRYWPCSRWQTRVSLRPRWESSISRGSSCSEKSPETRSSKRLIGRFSCCSSASSSSLALSREPYWWTGYKRSRVVLGSLA